MARSIKSECQQLRAKTGRIKRAIFQRLRTNRYIKASGRENSAVVEFTGKVQRIAKAHQYGLYDKLCNKTTKVKYEERKLLGFNEKALIDIENIIISQLINYRSE